MCGVAGSVAARVPTEREGREEAEKFYGKVAAKERRERERERRKGVEFFEGGEREEWDRSLDRFHEVDNPGFEESWAN